MERPIRFARNRYMLCEPCRLEWVVDLEWIDRWERATESCPRCGVTCEAENSARVTVDPDDSALVDENVARLTWYHTSTQSDWPMEDFDPAAGLTEEARQMMGGDRRVARWAAQQRAKALHVGTYEAAIHNMLRRIDHQADRGRQFYLYRVRLVPSVTVRDDWLIDPSNFAGDVVLDEVCSPGVDVARYLNYHEDPGGLSLALGRTAIASAQQVAIPTRSSSDSGWIATAAGELERVAMTPSEPAEREVWLPRHISRRSTPSPKSARARELVAPLAQRLPVNLRRQFESATAFDETLQPETWAQYVVGVLDLLLAPERVLAVLDSARVRRLL